MTWVIVANINSNLIYGRIDEDGLMCVTAIEGYPELDAWLAEGNTFDEPTPVATKRRSTKKGT